jgi:hypothetical protein
MAQAALPAGPTKQEHSTNIPKPFKRQAKGGKGGQRGQRGVCELAWYLGCPGGLVDKISAAVQIVDGNIGRRVAQWYCTRSFAARGILVQPRSRKPTLAVEEGSLLRISADLCVGAFDAFKSKYGVQSCTPY